MRVSELTTMSDIILDLIISESLTGEGAGNATFMLDMTEHGEVEDFVPGDGTDGNATFV